MKQPAGAHRVGRRWVLGTVLAVPTALLLAVLSSLVLLEDHGARAAVEPPPAPTKQRVPPSRAEAPEPGAPDAKPSRPPASGEFTFSASTFDDLDPERREAASTAALVSLAERGATPPASFEAADAVSRLLRTRRGVEALTASLADLSPAQRAWAVDLAAFRGGAHQLPLLREAVKDPDPQVRTRARRALETARARHRSGAR